MVSTHYNTRLAISRARHGTSEEISYLEASMESQTDTAKKG